MPIKTLDAMPDRLQIGDSASWYFDASDFPTATHELKWTFTERTTGAVYFSALVTEEASRYLVTLTPTDWAGIEPGEYVAVGRVTDGAGDTETVCHEVVTLLADPSTPRGRDQRPFAQRMVAKLEQVIEGSRDPFLLSTSIGGQSIQLMSLEERISALKKFKALAHAERMTEAAKRGTARNKLRTRM